MAMNGHEISHISLAAAFGFVAMVVTGQTSGPVRSDDSYIASLNNSVPPLAMRNVDEKAGDKPVINVLEDAPGDLRSKQPPRACNIDTVRRAPCERYLPAPEPDAQY
jgi:hypothetical protein